MHEILDVFRRVEESASLAEIAPELHVDGAPARTVEAPPIAPGDDLVRFGFARLGPVENADTCERLARGIERLVDAGLPAVFVYAFEEAWQLGESVRARASALVGEPYALLADAWAWKIAPGGEGWRPHRGVASPRLDRARPELLNTWVALRDVARDQSCMWFVPLDADPGYPSDLARVDAGAEPIPAPLARGDALVWNANVLHWGGPCAPSAPPRLSCSFSLVRSGADMGPRVDGPPDFRARLDLIAAQIVTYGDGQPDVSPAVFGWARATVALVEQRRSGRP